MAGRRPGRTAAFRPAGGNPVLHQRGRIGTGGAGARDFLQRMGREARQGAIGLVIDRDYLEIGFPLETAPPTKKKKRR